MTEVVIIVSPAFDRRGKRRHDRFDARVEDTDEVICLGTRQPVLDGSRVLLDKGHSPSTVIRMAYAHAPAVITGWAIIGEAAQYDVMGEKFVRRKTTAGSMPSAPIQIDVSAGPREPSAKWRPHGLGRTSRLDLRPHRRSPRHRQHCLSPSPS